MRREKDNTGRERLLKLIGGDTAALKEAGKRNGIKTALRAFNELIYLVKQGTRQTFQKLRKGEFSLSRLNITSLRKALTVILPIMFVYLMCDFFGAILFKKSKIVFPAGGVTSKESSIRGLSPLNYYLGEISGKDIFNSQRIAKVLTGGSDSLAQPIAGLKFVGADWCENPVVLIEDVQTGKTYFVKKGDSVKDFKVTEISRDRVTLRHGNKVVELK